MLRTTVAAFAAGVGGADAVTVLPFDSAARRCPTRSAAGSPATPRSLLISESHVAQVADPAGGSYAVEKLTDDLAAAAWAELGRIEEAGGVAPPSTTARSGPDRRGRRARDDADRPPQAPAHRRSASSRTSARRCPSATPLPAGDGVRRYGAPFEALRDEPAATPVFLATMGTVAAHTARATFATNLFAAGGVAVDVGRPDRRRRAVLAAYDGQPVVCLAGTDAAYAEWGADLVAALREAGAR